MGVGWAAYTPNSGVAENVTELPVGYREHSLPPKGKPKVDMEELAAALDDTGGEVNYYLDLVTGEVVLVPPRWRGSRCAEICPRRSERTR